MKTGTMLGFEEEQYVPESMLQQDYWTDFYTCICNGKRVYVWRLRNETCCLVINDDPARGADADEVKELFIAHWRRYQSKGMQEPSSDPILLQAAIHHFTSGGN